MEFGDLEEARAILLPGVRALTGKMVPRGWETDVRTRPDGLDIVLTDDLYRRRNTLRLSEAELRDENFRFSSRFEEAFGHYSKAK